MVNHFREFLVGQNPMQRGRIWQEMYRGQYFEGGRTITGAMSAIDIASTILSARNSAYLSTNSLVESNEIGSPPSHQAEARQPKRSPRRVRLSGPKASKLCASSCRQLAKTAIPTSSNPERVHSPHRRSPHKLREVLGFEPVIGIDYHHRLSVAEAASFCQMMPTHTLDFIEEPSETSALKPEELRNSRCPVRHRGGVASKWQFLPYIERGLTNYARLDICNVGGFTEAMKVAGWAEAHYIDLMPHNPLGPIYVAATYTSRPRFPTSPGLRSDTPSANPTSTSTMTTYSRPTKTRTRQSHPLDEPGLASKSTKRR